MSRGLQGFSLAVAHSTVVDIVQTYCASFEAVTTAQSVRALGFLAGFFLGALLTDRFTQYSDVTIAAFNLLYGAACCGVPWSPDLVVMGVLFFVQGWCNSILDISQFTQLLHIVFLKCTLLTLTSHLF